MGRSLLRAGGSFVAASASLCMLAACSGGGGGHATPPVPVTNSGAAAAVVAASRFLPSAAAGPPNAARITFMADPPRHLALATLRAAALPSPSQCVAAFGMACYTPQLIRSGYDVPAGFDGSGQTIVIVDAFGSPTIQRDLQTFDATFGLPNTVLNVYYPLGKVPFDVNDPNQVGWAFETSLDVEWSHAIAPGAMIDLVIAPTNFGDALNVVEGFAVQHHLGNVMSMSFGSPEATITGGGNNIQLRQADQIYQQAQDAGITVIASAGDQGASNGFGFPNAVFPASDPLVTAVGGTDLFLSDNGVYQRETVWNDAEGSLCPFGCTQGVFGATGGAPSSIFAAPSYQRRLSHRTARTTSDVAYDASVYTGILTYVGFYPDSSGQDGFYFTGGTSEGAPQWAGIVALADESAGHALGLINPRLYAIGANAGAYAAAFHDVTVGNNDFSGPGFSAGRGYDLPTGLGTPNVSNLIGALMR